MLYANEQSFTAFLPSMMCVFLSWASFWIKLSIGWVTIDILLSEVIVRKSLLGYLWSTCSCCFGDYNLFINQNYGQELYFEPPFDINSKIFYDHLHLHWEMIWFQDNPFQSVYFSVGNASRFVRERKAAPLRRVRNLILTCRWYLRGQSTNSNWNALKLLTFGCWAAIHLFSLHS